MNAKIENPKVFISYAWGTEDYNAKVLSFARDLMNDGIDVILDRWSLKEGNDTYAFMEQSVVDPTVTNVLILLDPNYEKKANNRYGGVGTETQIISPEIYAKMDREKYLPIVFERGDGDEMPKPQYLRSMLHFDLSKEERYNDEYQRLIKRLYGVEIIQKPNLGKMPQWVKENSTIDAKTRTKYEILEKQQSDNVKKDKFKEFLEDIEEKILHIDKNELKDNMSAEDYVSIYDGTKILRDEFLHLLKYISYVPESYKLIASMMEETCAKLTDGSVVEYKIEKTLLHELFIYTIAIYLRNKDYDALAHTLTKTYFVNSRSGYDANSFDVFYEYNGTFNKAMSRKDNKNYDSGTAQYWIDNINIETCSVNEFVFADIFCYNASIFIESYENHGYWFPISYTYSQNGIGLLQQFSIRLKSKEHLQKTVKVFGFTDVEMFKKKYAEIESLIKKGTFNDYRYSGAFESAPIMCEFVSSKELGTRN